MNARFLLLGFLLPLLLLVSCGKEDISEAKVIGSYILQSDQTDKLTLKQDHTFEHSFSSNGVVATERGEWGFLRNEKCKIGFTGEMHGFVLGMIGVRESTVVIDAGKVLIQGGKDNVDWYEAPGPRR